MAACNLSSEPFEAGASGCARYSNCDEANTSCSPSPPVMPTTGASGSGHSSGSKRARSPETSNKQAQTASTSRGGKKKVDARTSAFLDIAEQEPMHATSVWDDGLSDDDILVLCDAFKEEKNRNAFMSLNDKHARKWIEREIAKTLMANPLYKRIFSSETIATIMIILNDDDESIEAMMLLELESEPVANRVPRQRCRTRPFTGHQMLCDILSGHHERCCHNFRMSATTFIALRDALVERGLISSTRNMTADEQLGYFYMA
uniref:DUF8040 domain-containing protein n=1 Tax=Ananas comosus var. bracteatus TaxID=296719 RepID=A0A6V7P5G9_ANACO|nr:unnamed protein product [Ananas comosus var. bracteatus]